jgi:hypothetical protein
MESGRAPKERGRDGFHFSGEDAQGLFFVGIGLTWGMGDGGVDSTL